MRSIFVGKSGKASIDNIGDNVFLYEAKDGYHFITSDSVIPRKDGKERIVIIADGVLCAHGSATTQTVVETLLLNVDFAKWSGRESGLGISTMFGRAFVKFMHYFPQVLIGLIILGAFLSELLPGGGVPPP